MEKLINDYRRNTLRELFMSIIMFRWWICKSKNDEIEVTFLLAKTSDAFIIVHI